MSSPPCWNSLLFHLSCLHTSWLSVFSGCSGLVSLPLSWLLILFSLHMAEPGILTSFSESTQTVSCLQLTPKMTVPAMTFNLFGRCVVSTYSACALLPAEESMVRCDVCSLIRQRHTLVETKRLPWPGLCSPGRLPGGSSCLSWILKSW